MHATFGGVIRGVLVKETADPQFFYCTDPRFSHTSPNATLTKKIRVLLRRLLRLAV